MVEHEERRFPDSLHATAAVRQSFASFDRLTLPQLGSVGSVRAWDEN